jgi:hypothetical protein
MAHRHERDGALHAVRCHDLSGHLGFFEAALEITKGVATVCAAH